jgi:hypothetical protein
MPQWEYCSVRGIYNASNDWRTMYPRLYRFTDAGAQLTDDFKTLEQGMSEAQAVAQAIARLGQDGWEMVGIAGDGNGSAHCLYFKRARPENNPSPIVRSESDEPGVTSSHKESINGA